MNKLRRSLPYFQAILKSPIRFRWELLHSMPKFVQHDFYEVLQNIIEGRIDVGKKKQLFKKYRDVLMSFKKERTIAGKRRVLLERLPLKSISETAYNPTKSDGNTKKGKKGKKWVEKYLGTKPGQQTGEGFAFLAIPAIIEALKAIESATGGFSIEGLKDLAGKIIGG